MKKALFSLLEIAEVGIISLIIITVVRSVLVQPFLVSGASMEPNFSNGDYLLIDELTYRFRQPERGEVVVFRYPKDPDVFYIKRVLGLPGERVTVKDGGMTIENGEYPRGMNIDEAYLPAGLETRGDVDVDLGPGEYFVLGDNRQYSYDSRSWGAVAKDKIVGVVRLRLWPLNKVWAFEQPAYGGTR
ncbi:MAG: signal peptidase I [Candidatus Liptonbacteria bacterium]|nr:signal peptidase I [Candidatus Liptonbacteria bacterium]